MAPADPKTKPPAPPRDHTREAVETIVFVVVLVLLLKLFVTEAFVIPTGSMAETLYGIQKIITCGKCGHEFPMNAHDEVQGQQGSGRKLVAAGYCCPNCRYHGRVADLKPVPEPRTGDRVLVLKPIYHFNGTGRPTRGDVVVFKFPRAPQEKWEAANYIKRCMAFGGETVGIHRGDLYATTTLTYPPDAKDASGNPLYPRPDDPNDLWRGGESTQTTDFRYPNNDQAVDFFEKSRQTGFAPGNGGFEILRPTEEQVLARARVVWDNDHQPPDLAGKTPPRWFSRPEATGKWNGDNPSQPKAFGHTADSLDFIRYQHLVWKREKKKDDAGKEVGDWQRTGEYWTWGDWRPNQTDPFETLTAGPVDNFLGYNDGLDVDPTTTLPHERRGNRSAQDTTWVGDLILECEADVQAGAEVVLEVSRGQTRFQARFAGGEVELVSTGPAGKSFGKRPTKITAGKYKLRFANVDARLWVWVDGKRIDFGTDADYPPASTVAAGQEDKEGWTEENDVAAPASVGAKGGVTVRGLKLMRDIYYTRFGGHASGADLYYVQPGHYLCLGDNSAHSSDSRSWGVVPERLMLGKAVFVFWPAWPHNRVGFIR
ncbi:S26 family signal peptidase [Urbifossiella limnaea]|uniref:Signal peptidase I n=1 Tax=Urbifossiella limnaea TaxID=2528023 RepID=A0A517XZT1_9BACT|nr:S26 family signal peptidase [Urbifossiella limnaea]QDU23019.1 signal peptidase I [Urbifossiella limnaea]